MKPGILTENIWQGITEAVKANPSECLASVAFFATGAADMLPFNEGSILVVNASEGVVKSGQTNPLELIKLLKRKVRIFSCDNLHAKIFVRGSTMYIGSANVSNNSATGLQEAMLVTSDKSLVTQAKKTIKSFCIKDLGIERLKQLSNIYKAPKFIGGMPVSGKRNTKKRASDFYVSNLEYKNYPRGSEDAYEKGKKTAERKKENTQHQILDFWMGNKVKFKVGDTVFMIVKDGNGDCDIYPPGIIIHMNKWKENHFLTYIEAPNKRCRKLSALSKKMDTTPLKRGGYKRKDVAMAVLKTWNR